MLRGCRLAWSRLYGSGNILENPYDRSSNLRSPTIKEELKTISTLQLIPYVSALLFEEGSQRTVIITDLHIGWENELASRGIHLPSQTSKLKQKLFRILDKYKPNSLILLGDVKQAIPKISLEEWEDVPELFEDILEKISDISVIQGNHDGDLEPLLPSAVKVFPPDGIIIGENIKIGLFHGHAWPSPKILATSTLIMGHIHPVIRIRDASGLWILKQVWMKTKCYGEKIAEAYLKQRGVKRGNSKEIFEKKYNVTLSNPTLIVMPAFNESVGGVSVDNVEDNSIGPILRLGAANIADAELYLLDGNYLGAVKQFKSKDLS